MRLNQPTKESMKLFYVSDFMSTVWTGKFQRERMNWPWPQCVKGRSINTHGPLVYFVTSYQVLGLLMKPRRENWSELSWRLVSWVPFPSISATTDIYGHHWLNHWLPQSLTSLHRKRMMESLNSLILQSIPLPMTFHLHRVTSFL